MSPVSPEQRRIMFHKRLERAKALITPASGYSFAQIQLTPTLAHYVINGPNKPYTVKVHFPKAGTKLRYSCTCPDYAGEIGNDGERRSGLAKIMSDGYCKHILALLIHLNRTEYLLSFLVSE